jgi:phospholipid/cholesterol/gamma-HCH transport system substrate-binding protein
MSKEARVGIFVLLGLLILTFFTFRVSKYGGVGKKGYTVTADFTTAAGLEPKSDVKMAGVPIGKVEEIKLNDGIGARLVMRINDGVRIPRDSMASIQSQGMLGEKYVEIFPGQAKDQYLAPGGTLAKTQSPQNLDELVRKVSAIGDDIKRFTDSLAGTFGTPEGKQALNDILTNIRETSVALRTIVSGNQDRLNAIVANVEKVSADLKDVTAANKDNLRETIANLRAFSETLKEQTPEIARKINEAADKMGRMADKAGTMADNANLILVDNREGIRDSIASFKSASAKLDNTLASAGAVMAKIERGEGTLGKLVSDNSVAGSLTDTLDGINRLVRKGDSLKTFIDYRLEYRGQSSDYKHYVDVRLQPTADKYYLVGIADDPKGKLRSLDTTDVVTGTGGSSTTRTVEDQYENKLLFSALIAKRFSGLTLKGGVIESTGGVAADYQVIPDRLTVAAEAFNFSRKNDRPHLKAYANYDIVKNLFVTGGVDDIASKDSKLRTLFMGFGIKFADDDLKTLLGAIPIKP